MTATQEIYELLQAFQDGYMRREHTGLYVCRQPRQPWPQMWETMQWLQ